VQRFVARKFLATQSEQSTVALFTRAFTCERDWTWYVGKGFSDPAQEGVVNSAHGRTQFGIFIRLSQQCAQHFCEGTSLAWISLHQLEPGRLNQLIKLLPESRSSSGRFFWNVPSASQRASGVRGRTQRHGLS
jgi:hypothetical protein